MYKQTDNNSKARDVALANLIDDKPLRVIQISDSHLFADKQGKLLGLNTEDSFDKVFDLVRQEQAEGDVVLATGDLSQDGSKESYERLISKLEGFGLPYYWLEGNHDVTSPMLDALGSSGRLSPCAFSQNGWRFIMLDSSIPQEVPGELSDSDLAFLEKELSQSAGFHVMVCLHHHPLPMGCKWLDTQVVASSKRFFDVIDRYDNIRAIIWGHVHQEYEGRHGDVEMYSVPSTCVQFKPFSDDFAVDDANPGYRWFDLYPDGRIETQVSRVEGIKFEVDFSVKGY